MITLRSSFSVQDFKLALPITHDCDTMIPNRPSSFSTVTQKKVGNGEGRLGTISPITVRNGTVTGQNNNFTVKFLENRIRIQF